MIFAFGSFLRSCIVSIFKFIVSIFNCSKEKGKGKGQQTKKEQKSKDYKEPSQKWKQLDLVVDVNDPSIRYVFLGSLTRHATLNLPLLRPPSP